MNNYLGQLTWLRGLAALFVVCSNSIRAIEPVYLNEPKISDDNLFRLFDLGSFGVLLFFVLSGCTLTISNGLSFNSSNHVIGFFIKRFFRIWPAFLFAMIIYSLFRLIFQSHYGYDHGFWIERQFLEPVSTSDYISYLSLTFNYTGRYGLFNNAFWSLPVEFQYYLMFPILLLSLRLLNIVGPLLIGIGLYIVGRLVEFPPGIDNKFYLLAYSFCGGVLLGFLYIKKGSLIQINSYLASAATLFIIVVNALVYNHYIKLPDIIFISNIWNFHTLSALAVTALLLFSRIRLPQFLNKFLKLLGDVSYSSYLIHNLVIASMMLVVLELNLLSYEKYIVPVFAFTLTYIIAIYMYKFIEKPGISVGRYFFNRIVLKRQEKVPSFETV